MQEKYGYNIILAPLAPGHAFNSTDARIAHFNTLINLIKARFHLFGAEGIAKVMHEASNPDRNVRRTFVSRSYIFFRRVEAEGEASGKFVNVQMVNETLD